MNPRLTPPKRGTDRTRTNAPPGRGREGSGVGRFMESPHDFDAVHWDHEPRFCLTLTRNHTLTLRSSIKSRIKIKSKKSSAESARGVFPTAKVHGKPLLFFFRMHWDREPRTSRTV